jgi:hypothetical protein
MLEKEPMGGRTVKRKDDEGVSMIKILYLHVCKHHNESTLYN